ncbi:MAG: DnaA/Hda family protein [Planctomycetaceae bacterium]|nr:DnaA/Hda family protein [Planctomycetaceae bacterium]
MTEILRFPGTPLRSNSPAGEAVFSLPEQGFLAGPENAVLIPLTEKILEETLERTQLPVFFFGASGCGKTHILRGIYTAKKNSLRNTAVKNTGEKKSANVRKVLYLTSTDFSRSFTEAIDTKTVNEYRKRFRSVSLLLLDDIDHILGKEHLLQELQFALDELTANGVPAVFTAKQYPTVSGGYPEALCGRLIAGTVISILPPGIEVRTRFLAEMSAAYHLPLSASVLEKAALHLPFQIPMLYQAVTRMVFEAKSENKKIDSDYFLRFIFEESIPRQDKKAETESIIKKTAKYFSLKQTQLKGKSRCKTTALARSIAVYLIRKKTGLQYKEIAGYFSGRDVSTLRHLSFKIETGLKDDLQLRKHIAAIEQ